MEVERRGGDMPAQVSQKSNSQVKPDVEVEKLYLLVHGWLGSFASFSSISSSSSSSRKVKDEELADIKNELLRVENATVIVVDWFEKAKYIYSESKQNAKQMADGMAWLVKTLVEAGALRVSKVHYIGHSLGAQAAGYFAQSLKLILNGQKIGRITGLDPAIRGFEDEHLDTDDADFVDVIHTSNGILHLGMRDPIGHVDFYPDGGGRQSGCYIFAPWTAFNSDCKEEVSVLVSSLVNVARNLPGNVYKTKCKYYNCNSAAAPSASALALLQLLALTLCSYMRAL
ncbi:hypothetical protein HPB47_015357 [Ixodes persulcatus]|uniref:Uncharacterized protein n=1 Tax=Ixodes persulcatus TaxID=34615 RepID=A0AC60QX91_IXOPE|nr:hypothetical protein HPB47_015357 [Ixodes persulcatus]